MVTYSCILLASFVLSSSFVPFAAKKEKPAPPKARVVLATRDQLKDKTYSKIQDHKRLTGREKKEVAKAEMRTYKELRRKGFDEISTTPEAVMLRDYRLRNKKKIGLFRKEFSQVSLSQILFPDVSPEYYNSGESVSMFADLIESKMTQIPFDYYDLPVCPLPEETPGRRQRRVRKVLELGCRAMT